MIRRRAFSLQDIFNWAFSLIGLIPYLLAVYIMISIHAGITQDVLLIAAIIFCSHLLGLILLRSNRNKLKALNNRISMAITASKWVPIRIQENAPMEISGLAHSFNTMITEMDHLSKSYRAVITKLMLYTKDIQAYQKKLKKEETIRHRLGRYVGQNVVEQIVNSDGDLPLQNKSREVTILFADIRSFTTLSENMQPEEIITMLNEYFDTMVDIVFENNGVLDKFVGDELMAVFGAIGPGDQAANNAIRTALAMQEKLGEWMARRSSRNQPVFETGIGINTGKVVIGNVGSRNHMDYTVIGDTVNVAARLEQMAKAGKILIGERTKQCCTDNFQIIENGIIKVRNRSEPVKSYEVTGLLRDSPALLHSQRKPLLCSVAALQHAVPARALQSDTAGISVEESVAET